MPTGEFVPSRIHYDYPEWQAPGGSDSGKVWAWNGTGYAPASFLLSSAVSAFGLTLIDDADAATARTTLGLGTMATATESAYLLANGSRAGATASRQAFTQGITTGSIRPASDSTTALQWQNAAGVPMVTVDTTNSRMVVASLVPISNGGGGVGSSSLNYGTLYTRNIESGGNLQVTAGIGGGSITLNANGASSIAQFASTGISLNKTVTFAAGAGLIITGSVALGDAAGANRNHAMHGHTTFTPGVDTTGVIVVVKGYTGSTQNLMEWQSSASAILSSVDVDGKFSIGQPSGTALLDLAASTTARASLRIRTGTAPTSPNAGDIYFNGTNFFGYNGSAWKQLDN